MHADGSVPHNRVGIGTQVYSHQVMLGPHLPRAPQDCNRPSTRCRFCPHFIGAAPLLQLYILQKQTPHTTLQADVAAVILNTNLAYVCLITGEMTITRAKIEVNIPKKRIGSHKRSDAVAKFFELILKVRHLAQAVLPCQRR